MPTEDTKYVTVKPRERYVGGGMWFDNLSPTTVKYTKQIQSAINDGTVELLDEYNTGDSVSFNSVDTGWLNGTEYLKRGTGEDIQRAVDRAHDAGGGCVVLGPSTFVAESTIELPADVRLVGQGTHTTIKLADGANTDLIAVTNQGVFAAAETIENLSLHGNRENNSSGRGVVVYPFSLRFHIHNAQIRYFAGNGIEYINDTSNPEAIYEPILTQSVVGECDGDGIVVQTDCLDLYLANTSVSSCQRGYVLGAGGHSLVHAHAVTNRGAGIVADDCDRSWFYDPYGDTNDGHGIHIINSTDLVLVAGRSMKNGTPDTPKDGIRLESSYNNRIIGITADDPRASADKTQRWGINEGTTASGNYVAFTNLLNNVQGGFNGSRSTEHLLNIGYSSQSSGITTITGDGSTTRFDLGTHGLDATPSDPDDAVVNVTGANYDGSKPVPMGGSLGYGSDGNLTHVYAHFPTAPPDTTDVRVRWQVRYSPT